ncbi:hypothetical protein SteCoe_38232 [Stentor coeruleus]|uniref:Uncharacterized protein n=1 Tax=Stentor coeruleus TaxID=5963 RepID=A0A1R2ALP5_9CILI|nr:hypothetical protein SteCoe_38232 [Stentor coeruleus]
MLSDKSKRTRFHYSEELSENIAKGLRNLSPQCASNRLDLSIGSNVERAYANLIKIQLKYIAQRETIRRQLYNNSEYKERVSRLESPKKQQKSFVSINLTKKLPIKNLELHNKSVNPKKKYLKRSSERADYIDNFIENCLEVKEQSRGLSNDLPMIGKIFNHKFNKIERTVTMMQDEDLTSSDYFVNNSEFERRLFRNLLS